MRTLSVREPSARTLTASAVVALTIVLAIGYGACGGTVGPDASCPAGYVCVPECTDGRCSDGGVLDAPLGQGDADALLLDARTSLDSGYPEGSVPPTSSTVTVLSHNVVDAKLSDQLSSIVMVSDTPSNVVILRDMASGTERSMPLPDKPVAVTIDATGVVAAVLYDAQISWIDLGAGTIKATCPTGPGGFDVALTVEGTAYVTIRSAGNENRSALHVADLTTCKDTPLGNNTDSLNSHVVVHPTMKVAFTATTSDIEACNLSLPLDAYQFCTPLGLDPLDPTNPWSDWPTTCDKLWLSRDGLRIFTACGAVLPAAIPKGFASVSATLDGVTRYVAFATQHASEAASAPRLALIPEVIEEPPLDWSVERVVRLYETNYLGLLAQYQLPMFPVADGAFAPAFGRFVFPSPSADVLYVIEQADPSSGVLHDYAIATLTP